MKLTQKQRLFADEYIKSGNATQSYIKAGYRVKSEKVAGVNANRMLKNARVKSYIDARMAEIESHKIADAKEVLQYLTRVLRGEETEEIPDSVDGGTIKRPPLIKDRTAAAREIMKRYPLDDPMVAAQLKKLQAEADTAIWKRDELTGKNDTGDKTVLIDDIGGIDDGNDKA
ncbi:terminase small subunit [Limosilactobacillus mucosae]|uniref:terminase small subunit n=1 Tax=Limosilactobacillus mucosae TaxID=97478 RepID=UPI00233F7405|nr:terminase small subunit [Limosilactobacillus mucosae]MDC2838288.1 terminase small subunit [Limosilactobacillus mucosae]